MNWLMTIFWDYFPCANGKCKYEKDVNKELIVLVNDLLKTQNEILKFIDLRTNEKCLG